MEHSDDISFLKHHDISELHIDCVKRVLEH